MLFSKNGQKIKVRQKFSTTRTNRHIRLLTRRGKKNLFEKKTKILIKCFFFQNLFIELFKTDFFVEISSGFAGFSACLLF